MVRQRSRRILAASGTALVFALVLTGCGAPPSTTPGASADNASSFLPCAVSDVTGFSDKDFNQLTWEGVVKASKAIGVTPKSSEPTAEDQYDGSVSALVDQSCNLIVTVGFALANATRDAAKANPDTKFALIDSRLSDASGKPLDLPNVRPVLFDTAQAAALAGYLAAGTSKTGVVGTYGGMPFPSVTVFMDGFADGVQHYNEVHKASVRLVGWDKAAQNGVFVGGFTDQVKAKTVTEGLLDQGADVIMPVAGHLFESSIAAAQAKGVDVAIIGVNGDAYDASPSYRKYYLTSVLKNLTLAADQVTTDTASGKFSNAAYIGTLKNEGVGIAPLHDWESKVDRGLQKEVEDLRTQIIDGKFVVTSAASPKQ